MTCSNSLKDQLTQESRARSSTRPASTSSSSATPPPYEHALGGYRVQGRGDAAERVLSDARAVQEAGSFAVLMEMVPGDVAAQVTQELDIPTIGIGAQPDRRPGTRLAGRVRPQHRPAAAARQAVRRPP